MRHVFPLVALITCVCVRAYVCVCVCVCVWQVRLGETLVQCVGSKDVELLKMSRAQLDELMTSMLTDLKKMLDTLQTGLTVRVGGVKPLLVKFNAVTKPLCYLLDRYAA
jgi:hypothetical protein